jgi:hypothetical protein
MRDLLIRSVFDQYSHVENRLTHGLTQVLARDQRLARCFIREFAEVDAPAHSHLSFACQTAPGEPSRLATEEAPTESSVPDAWIFQEEAGWALVIESKAAARLDETQLRRHIDTAERKGFQNLHVLAITAEDAAPTWLAGLSTKADIRWTAWARVYEFLAREELYSNPISRFLGGQLLAYLRMAEARQMAGERVLTSFTGIPFGPDHPFNEPEARVVLRSLMQKLRPKLARSKVLSVPSHFDQKPLTGTWDVIGFGFAKPGEPFTSHPHLTVWVGDGSAIELTVPNGAKTEYWKRLTRGDSESLDAALSEVVEQMRPLRRAVGRGRTEPRLMLEINQRHFHARRQEIVDGRLEFDLDALYAREGPVKRLPAWLEAARAVLADSARANVQAGLYAHYPFLERSVSRTREFLDVLVTAAEAFHPFLAFLQGTSSPSSRAH